MHKTSSSPTKWQMTSSAEATSRTAKSPGPRNLHSCVWNGHRFGLVLVTAGSADDPGSSRKKSAQWLGPKMLMVQKSHAQAPFGWCKIPVNTGIIYQLQLISRISSIKNSIFILVYISTTWISESRIEPWTPSHLHLDPSNRRPQTTRANP